MFLLRLFVNGVGGVFEIEISSIFFFSRVLLFNSVVLRKVNFYKIISIIIKRVYFLEIIVIRRSFN